MSAKFGEEAQNGSLYHFHKLITKHIYCDLDLLPLTSKINRVNPLAKANISSKFDEEACSSLVSIVFISLFPYRYLSIVNLTFDL